MERYFCSAAAEDRDEPAVGTASRIDRWLLIETHGPWGARALPEVRDLDDTLLLALQHKAKATHARTLLIRRPRTDAVPRDRRRIFVADSRPGHTRLLTRTYDDQDLPGLVLPFDADPAGWEPATALVGVCTHGKHDPCCAVRGRPVAAALFAAHPNITWEISHLGGDRFAANLLILPHGHYLGRVPADEAVTVVDTLLAGRRPDPYYRGRSCYSTPVQAALNLTGIELGIDRLNALKPLQLRKIADDAWDVDLDAEGKDVTARLERSWSADTSLLTCRAPTENPVPSWQLVGLGPRPRSPRGG